MTARPVTPICAFASVIRVLLAADPPRLTVVGCESVRAVTVLAIVAAASLAAWLWLALVWGRFWRTDQRLPPCRRPATWPSVAVVVPARDEAAMLPRTLPTLLAQDYAGPMRVIVVDDASSDGTGARARALGAEVVDAGEPPPGWTGKLNALDRGVASAGDAEFLLLTDADIAHERGSLTALVEAAVTHDLDVVSQMARLRVHTGWERLVVPAFVYFFAMLYPFRWVNRPHARTAAAAGGCSMLRRSALERAGGLDAVHGAVIDDVAIARLIKCSGGRLWLGLADHVESVRPYPRLADLWRMVSRSAFSQLRYSTVLLIGTVVGLGLVFVVPVAALAWGSVAAALGATAWLIMTLTFVPTLRAYRQPIALAVTLPVTAALYALMTIDSARRHWLGRGAAWKGRTYPRHRSTTRRPCGSKTSSRS
jgi:hopene-associated glycosyltransferase HpnB